jgi:hypothetical protein
MLDQGGSEKPRPCHCEEGVPTERQILPYRPHCRTVLRRSRGFSRESPRTDRSPCLMFECHRYGNFWMNLPFQIDLMSATRTRMGRLFSWQERCNCHVFSSSCFPSKTPKFCEEELAELNTFVYPKPAGFCLTEIEFSALIWASRLLDLPVEECGMHLMILPESAPRGSGDGLVPADNWSSGEIIAY